MREVDPKIDPREEALFRIRMERRWLDHMKEHEAKATNAKEQYDRQAMRHDQARILDLYVDFSFQLGLLSDEEWHSLSPTAEELA